MVIVEVRLSFESLLRIGLHCFLIQLNTGKVPFPEKLDPNVVVLVFQGKRPPKPRRFEAQGMNSAVWKIAEKCWHQKAKERPEVSTVLQDLENMVYAGGCTHSACICLPWEVIDP